jgi:hypothetical protein
MNLSVGSIEVLINVILMDAVKDDPKEVMTFSFSIYGIGSVFGPILVSIFGIGSLLFCGVWAVIIGFMHFYVLHLNNIEK